MSLDRGLIAQTFCGILLLGEAAFVHLTGSATKHFGEEEPDDPSSPLPCYEEAAFNRSGATDCYFRFS